MEERIGFSSLRLPVAVEIPFRRFENRMVFGMERDQLGRHPFEARKRITRAEFFPCADQEATSLIARGGEHRRSLASLVAVFAEIADHAFGTAGVSREADVAPVKDQPMVRVLAE